MRNNTIHETAIIEEGAVIGNNNYIGAYVVIHNDVTIGDNNHIGDHCIIGDAGESIRFFGKEPKGVIIGDNNRFTKQVTIDQGTEITTEVHNNVLVLKNGHIGHDAIIKDGAQIRANALVGGHSVMSEGSIICLSVVIQPRITLPIDAYIGACSNITKKSKLLEGYVHYGNPCKPIRLKD